MVRSDHILYLQHNCAIKQNRKQHNISSYKTKHSALPLRPSAATHRVLKKRRKKVFRQARMKSFVASLPSLKTATRNCVTTLLASAITVYSCGCMSLSRLYYSYILSADEWLCIIRNAVFCCQVWQARADNAKKSQSSVYVFGCRLFVIFILFTHPKKINPQSGK